MSIFFFIITSVLYSTKEFRGPCFNHANDEIAEIALYAAAEQLVALPLTFRLERWVAVAVNHLETDVGHCLIVLQENCHRL